MTQNKTINEQIEEADIQKRMCQAQYPLGVLLIEQESQKMFLEEIDKWYKNDIHGNSVFDKEIQKLKSKIGGEDDKSKM